MHLGTTVGTSPNCFRPWRAPRPDGWGIAAVVRDALTACRDSTPPPSGACYGRYAVVAAVNEAGRSQLETDARGVQLHAT